jgi:hypothetical protein
MRFNALGSGHRPLDGNRFAQLCDGDRIVFFCDSNLGTQHFPGDGLDENAA